MVCSLLIVYNFGQFTAFFFSLIQVIRNKRNFAQYFVQLFPLFLSVVSSNKIYLEFNCVGPPDRVFGCN